MKVLYFYVCFELSSLTNFRNLSVEAVMGHKFSKQEKTLKVKTFDLRTENSAEAVSWQVEYVFVVHVLHSLLSLQGSRSMTMKDESLRLNLRTSI